MANNQDVGCWLAGTTKSGRRVERAGRLESGLVGSCADMHGACNKAPFVLHHASDGSLAARAPSSKREITCTRQHLPG